MCGRGELGREGERRGVRGELGRGELGEGGERGMRRGFLAPTFLCAVATTGHRQLLRRLAGWPCRQASKDGEGQS